VSHVGALRRILPKLGSASGIIVIALLVIYGLLAITAGDPLQATRTLLTGPLSDSGRVTQWLNDSTDLMLTGLAVALVFRVGQFSLGAEGQLAMGALASGALLLHLGDFAGMWLVGLLVACIAGFLWGLIPGLMKAYGDADEIVSTLMLNYLALFFFSFAIKQWLQPKGAGYAVSSFLPFHAWVPTYGTGPTIPLGFVVAVVLCVAGAAFLARTQLGFAMRMTGLNMRFATGVGLRVDRSIWLSMAMSGAVAGLAGGLVVQTETHRLILGLSGNIGYDGILVALLAANRPLLVPAAALAYGYLRTGGDVAQLRSSVPRELITTVQGVLILFVTAKFTGVGARLRRLAHRNPPRATSDAAQSLHGSANIEVR
jgi:general nucleoside transport system permease protein